MSVNIRHLVSSAEKKFSMSSEEVRRYVRDKSIPPLQERMKKTLEHLATDPVDYLRDFREELLIDLEEIDEDIALINIVMQDLADCLPLLERYNISLPETSPLVTYSTHGVHSDEGDEALFLLLKDAGFTIEEVGQFFKDKAEHSSSHKMKNAVSLQRLVKAYK